MGESVMFILVEIIVHPADIGLVNDTDIPATVPFHSGALVVVINPSPRSDTFPVAKLVIDV